MDNELFNRFARSKGFDSISDYVDDQLDQGNEHVLEELEMMLVEPEIMHEELFNKGF